MNRDHQPLGFNEVEVGDCWTSGRRTVTETDVVMFAGMTGDYNPLHIDHEHARNSPFRQPIAHGLLGLSLVAGLGSNSPWMKTAAFTRIVEWNFLKPIYIGDTLRVETEIIEKTVKGKRRGLITWKRQLFNQNDEVVQGGTTETLVEISKPQK